MGKRSGQRPVGRPSMFSPVLGQEICRRLASGQSLREIGRDPDMPQPITVRCWLTDGKHAEFAAQYAQARADQADHYFDEIFEIADDGTNDWVERERKNGTTEIVLDREHVERSKLRVDARKWALARMSPKKYGDRTNVDHSGDVNVTCTIVEGLKAIAARRHSRLGSSTGANGHAH